MTGAITKMASAGAAMGGPNILGGLAESAMANSPILQSLNAIGSGQVNNPFANALGGAGNGMSAEAPNSLPQLDALPQLDLTGQGAQSAVQPSTPAGSGNAEAYRNAISSIESAGNYGAIGPTHEKMGRALGKYQVMEANLPLWSREAVGRVVSPQEFLKSPEIQDAIFDKKFGTYVNKFGEAGAAQAWFAGEGGVGKNERKDSLGTSVGVYGDKFMKALGKPVGASHPTGGVANAGTPQVSDDPYATIFANMFQAPDKPGQGEQVQKSAMERMADAVAAGGRGGGMQVASGGAEAPQVAPAYDDSPEYLAQANQRINTARGGNTRAQERKMSIRDKMGGQR